MGIRAGGGGAGTGAVDSSTGIEQKQHGYPDLGRGREVAA